MTQPDHLSNELLIRAMDDELSGSEEVWVHAHLARCGECRRNYQQFGLLSNRVESLVADRSNRAVSGATDLSGQTLTREKLSRAIEERERPPLKPPKKVIWGLGWGMGMAAALAAAVLFIPRGLHTPNPAVQTMVEQQPLETFEVADETFVALPYSNRDLPLNAPEIVQMRVPVSSLADAGIYGAVAINPSFEDESVLADVLLGADGEPLGVHVLNID